MSTHGDILPPTAVCPGCGTLVVLPAEPRYPDSPPAICATCDSEVPDYRRDGYMPQAGLPPSMAEPLEDEPVENRRFSRGGLFRSLGGMIADRGVTAVESAKDRFNA